MSVFTKNFGPIKTRTMRSLTYLSEGVDDDNNIDDRNYENKSE